MNEEKYYIKISPESLKSDIVEETLSGVTFGVYSAMTQILSGGTDGSSLLTGLTVPIVFNQTFDDMGFYSTFDGFLLQKDVVSNFIISGDPQNQFVVKLYNTSDQLKKFLKLSTYVINWGDGTVEPFTAIYPDFMEHTYPPLSSTYSVTLTQKNPWGVTNIIKKITIPNELVTINNPMGEITFTPQGGNWANIPINYDFIFTGDSENTVSAQTSNQTFIITGYTSSQLTNLKLYGPTKYNTSVVVKRNNENYGRVTEITDSYTAYTIQNVDYYDYTNGKTLFVLESSGITDNMIVADPITKEEVLFGVVSSPEIQSQIFIDRGKNSAFEGIQRLGEVDNIGDLVSYGYGFFKIKEQK
jgi:hypothetical protein|tara:strand:+ start:5535 stop:6605 length:1071 start_codon:yes stop_codon:yes gene_type:complete